MHSLQLSPAVLQGLSCLANPQDSSWTLAAGPESFGQKSSGDRLAVLDAHLLHTNVQEQKGKDYTFQIQIRLRSQVSHWAAQDVQMCEDTLSGSCMSRTQSTKPGHAIHLTIFVN